MNKAWLTSGHGTRQAELWFWSEELESDSEAASVGGLGRAVKFDEFLLQLVGGFESVGSRVVVGKPVGVEFVDFGDEESSQARGGEYASRLDVLPFPEADGLGFAAIADGLMKFFLE